MKLKYEIFEPLFNRGIFASIAELKKLPLKVTHSLELRKLIKQLVENETVYLETKDSLIKSHEIESGQQVTPETHKDFFTEFNILINKEFEVDFNTIELSESWLIEKQIEISANNIEILESYNIIKL